MDLREHNPDDLEETLRVLVAGIMSQHRTAIPVQVVQDTEDGHVSMIQPLVKRKITDPDDGTVTYLDHPPYPDAPIHHMGGGGVSKTFPNKSGDTGTAIFSDRPIDGPFQSDGAQPPIDDRVHSFADATFLSGFRSIPRMIQQVAKDSAQTRSDDGHHTSDLHPQNGITHKSVDPSTAVASASFNPFTDAAKHYTHVIQAALGIVGNATDGGTTHSHGVSHAAGAWMSAFTSAGSNFVRAHPVLGSILSALDGKHSVTAGLGGVAIQSATAISLACPPSGLGLPAGGVGGGALASGAASSNIGALGGDLSGELPNPKVVGVLDVANAHLLPQATSDSAAAAVGVAVGGFYLDTSIAAGKFVVVPRMV